MTAGDHASSGRESSERPGGAFEFIGPLRDETAPTTAGPLVVRIPRGVTSKQALLAALAQGLRLPDYFGWNWDALEECLRDLSWLSAGREVVIEHAGLPLRGRSRRTYLQVLDAVARRWRERSERRVRIVFRASHERAIKRALAGGRGDGDAESAGNERD